MSRSIDHVGVGSRVKYSTAFIRSLGNVGVWRSEVRGTVVDMIKMSGTDLALIEWDGGNGIGEVNSKNLVLMDNVAKEARRAESDGIRGLVIGSNAYADPQI